MLHFIVEILILHFRLRTLLKSNFEKYILCIYYRVCGKRSSYYYPKAARAERSIGQRRWSLSDFDPDFSISGETYQGFDEDGLPVEVGSNRSYPH